MCKSQSLQYTPNSNPIIYELNVSRVGGVFVAEQMCKKIKSVGMGIIPPLAYKRNEPMFTAGVFKGFYS